MPCLLGVGDAWRPTLDGPHGTLRVEASASDTLRALACEDFSAVLLAQSEAALFDRLVASLARLVDLRPMPRWLVVCRPSRLDACRRGLSPLARACGVTCLAPSDAHACLERCNRRDHGLPPWRRHLDGSLLARLRTFDSDRDDFLSNGFELYRRQGCMLLERLRGAATHRNPREAATLLRNLMTVAGGIGDLGTCNAARALLERRDVHRLAVEGCDQLSRAFDIGQRSLQVYLSAREA